MCAILRPWVFALIGVSLNVVSVIVSGYWVSVKQKKKLKAEDECIRLQTMLDKSFQEVRTGEYKYNFALLLRAIIEAGSMPSEIISYHNGRVANTLVDAIVSMSQAVTGYGPPEEQMESFFLIVNEARGGDQSYFPRLEKIYNDLKRNYPDRHKTFFSQRDCLKAKESRLNARIERARYIALGCQIFGLILVLIKDLL